VFVRGESDVRSMLCYIVNASVCVIVETILTRGESWITPNIIPTSLLTWNMILTHLLVLEIFSGGSDLSLSVSLSVSFV
jgi:hypothetical protein